MIEPDAAADRYGRDVALYLRERKSTRHVPIVFVGGATGQGPPDARVAAGRRIVTEWGDARHGNRQAR